MITPQLAKLNRLTLLGLGMNSLSGSIPTELGNPKSLSQLFLEENELTGEIPSVVATKDGRACEVLTPQSGSRFDSESYSFSGPPSAVLSGDYIADCM